MAKSNLFSRILSGRKSASRNDTSDPAPVAKTANDPDLTTVIADQANLNERKIDGRESAITGLKDVPTDTPSGGQAGTLPFGKEPPAGVADRVAPVGDSAVDDADQAASDAIAALQGRKADLLDQFGADLGAGNDANNRTPDISDGQPLTGRPSIDGIIGDTTTGEEEAAAAAVGQLLGGFENVTSGSGSFLNDPLVAASIALVDEQANSAATGPSVADGGALSNAINSVTQAEIEAQARKLGVEPPAPAPAPAPAGTTPDPAPAPAAEEPGFIDSIISFFKGAEVGSNVNAEAQLKELEGDVGAPVGTTTVSGALKQQGIKNLETAIGDVIGGIAGSGSKDGGGVKDPGPDGDQLGPPTEAEIAFRNATRDALGIRRIPGDIDPVEDTQTGPIDPTALAAAISKTSNESLVGQPVETPVASSGGGQQGGPSAGNPQGTNIDPVEGDAFTGPSRGGNPEDLDFGSGPLLGLDEASRATDEEEESSTSSEEEEADSTANAPETDD